MVKSIFQRDILILPGPEILLLAQLEVILGVTWAWLWAGEQVSLNTLTGGALVLGALIVNAVSRIFRQQKGKDLTA